MQDKDTNKSVFGQSAQALNYDLPENRIARYPLPTRDESKLLVYKDGEIIDSHFYNLTDFLPEKSMLVFNNTKVIHARLIFQKETGAKIEIFCLDPFQPSDYQLSFQQKEECTWHCMIGNLKKWKSEILSKDININGKTIHLLAEKKEVTRESVIVRFKWDDSNTDFSTLIENAGILPIPPYLNRETENSDLVRYQTIYSKIQGSVAAPTAGLHFTDRVFKKLKEKNIFREEITLHVGAGTFKPVKAKTIREHEMHSERIMVKKSFIEKIRDSKSRIIAVGTTSIRTLESLYWLGVKFHDNPNLSPDHNTIEQWCPYKGDTRITRKESMQAILDMMEKHNLPFISASTKIIIVPGYKFKIVEGMITNFHQPQSTLLLLIAAYLGDHWKEIYHHALDNNYRFLSYGDSNLYL